MTPSLKEIAKHKMSAYNEIITDLENLSNENKIIEPIINSTCKTTPICKIKIENSFDVYNMNYRMG
jgi:hypothetical protein